MLNEQQLKVLDGGPAALVGSVGADGEPECLRCWGVVAVDEGKAIRFTLPDAGSERMLAHIEVNPRLALAFTCVVTMESYQVKGRVEVAAATEADAERAARHAKLFGDNAVSVGIPESCRNVRYAPKWSVTLAIEQLFVQTPGPGAGRAIGGEA